MADEAGSQAIVVEDVQDSPASPDPEPAPVDVTAVPQRVLAPQELDILENFGFEHLATGELRNFKKKFHDFAHQMLQEVDSSAETTAGLRKLLETSDCFVRSKVKQLKRLGMMSPRKPE